MIIPDVRHLSRASWVWIALSGFGILAACLIMVAGLAASGGAEASDPAQGLNEIQRVHEGKVDPATLERITEGASSMNAGQNSEARLIAAAFVEDGSAVADYLARSQRPARPDGVLLVQSAPPSMPATPATSPVGMPKSDDTAAPSYAGPQICAACHKQEATNWAHTIHAKVFQLNPRNTTEPWQCEACHGPGSAHVQNPQNLATIISFSHKSVTPVSRQNAQCLSCHEGGQRIFWHGSIHENNRLACSDCHNPMTNFSSRGLTARDSINQTCFSCHKVQRAEFNKRSHMPLPEGKLSCTDCHNPHGSTTEPLLKADSVNELCYGCHAEKRGPFIFEHAPVRENCMNCHSPHGSNFESLLATPRPILCQQCHAQDGHPGQLLTRGNLAGGPRPDPRLISTSCQTCHVNIHGSNSPSGPRFER